MSLFDPATIPIAGGFKLRDPRCQLVPFTQLSYMPSQMWRCLVLNYAHHAAAVAKTKCPAVAVQYAKIETDMLAGMSSDPSRLDQPLTSGELNQIQALLVNANKACGAPGADKQLPAGSSASFWLFLIGIGGLAWWTLSRWNLR